MTERQIGDKASETVLDISKVNGVTTQVIDAHCPKCGVKRTAKAVWGRAKKIKVLVRCEDCKKDFTITWEVF